MTDIEAERARPLTGKVVALPEKRELDRLASLLEAEGAEIWRCPLVTILDTPDQGPVEDWVRRLGAGQLDDVIFLTGEGLRRLVDVAARLDLHDAFVGALARARKITRGPKPARVLTELGLRVDIAASVPTSHGVKETLAPLDLRGRRVGLQLYGEEPNRDLVQFLRGAGATVDVVAPYVYAPASADAQVLELIDAMAADRVDAIAFTSASQVDRICDVARRNGRDADLAQAWANTRTAAIGPVVKEALIARGVQPDVVPEKAFVMKRLVAAITDALS